MTARSGEGKMKYDFMKLPQNWAKFDHRTTVEFKAAWDKWNASPVGTLQGDCNEIALARYYEPWFTGAGGDIENSF